MKLYYDLHIHSGLSPCADNDMTPNNIVNMAYIKKIDLISVTDHNSILNYPAVSELCKNKNIKTIPGIEVTSKEDVHLLCYFCNYEKALEFSNLIYKSLPNIKNNKKIFSNQYVYDINDNIVNDIEKLLSNSSSYSLKEIYTMTEEYEGICIPAHINRLANGIIGVLGFIPEDLNFRYLEINDEDKISTFKDKLVLKNSDAHRLVDISERVNYIESDKHVNFFKLLKGC